MIASLLLFAQVSATPAAALPAFDASRIPDPVLATQRGGVRLPNGIDLALTVQTQTAVDGAVVLQTVFSVDRGPATLTIYAPPVGARVAERTSTESWVAPAPMTPVVSYDPRTGMTVTQGYTGMPIAVGSGPASGVGKVAEGLEAIDPRTMPQTAGGTVTSQSDGLLRTVTLAGADFNVAHLAGAAFGSAVANSGSDRTIDTITGISLDLRNAGPDVLGSTFLRIDDLAAGALSSRL